MKLISTGIVAISLTFVTPVLAQKHLSPACKKVEKDEKAGYKNCITLSKKCFAPFEKKGTENLVKRAACLQAEIRCTENHNAEYDSILAEVCGL